MSDHSREHGERRRAPAPQRELAAPPTDVSQRPPSPESLLDVQRRAGNRAAAAYVQTAPSTTRPTRTVYDQVVRASNSNWIGNVDEGACLALVAQLSGPERTRAVADTALLRRLASAFDAGEMVRLCDALPFTLAQKLFWCDDAGEIDNVPVAVLRNWFTIAPRAQILDVVRRQSILELVAARLPAPPAVVLRQSFPGVAVLDLYGGSIAAARWLGRSPAGVWIKEISPPGAPQAKIRAAKQRLVEAGLWTRVAGQMPRGARLGPATRAAMLQLVAADNTEAIPLFPVRFDKPLKGTWNPLDVLAVWRQLDVLPDQDVSANTVLDAFQAITGDRGFWSGGDTVQLGAGLRTSALGAQRLPHTVRHEIGHAVHDKLGGTVNSWLRQGVQFWFHAEGRAGIRQMIVDYGGWPATYKNSANVNVPFGAAERRRVEAMLAAHVNSDNWAARTNLPSPPVRAPMPAPGAAGPGMAPAAAGRPPAATIAELWEAMPGPLQQSFAGSASFWYKNYMTHPRGANGFTFYNHWYNRPFYFSPVAKAAIIATGDDYSAMSEKEFFANCYAEYFEDPAGAADHTKWGGSLSGDVKSFFREHIVTRQPYKYAAGAGAGSSLPRSPNQVPRP